MRDNSITVWQSVRAVKCAGGLVFSEALGSGRGGALVGAHTTSRRRWPLIASAAAAALLALTACTGSHNVAGSPVAGSSHDDAPQSTLPHSSAPPTPSVVITAAPAATHDISPIQPISVSVADGKLTSVQLVNSAGKAVSGELAADQMSWHNTEALGYAKSYTLTASAQDASGTPATKTTKYTTLSPNNLTMPYLNTTGGQSLRDGATYGVGIVPVVHFDEQITNRKAAEKALTVTTTPAVQGRWNWVSDTDVHWRAENYLAPGTKVTVTAKVYGVDVGHGLYGQDDQSVSFIIGAKHVSVADDKTHMVKVYFDDKLVRTMPTSMGQGGYVTGTGGRQISLWTMPGTYTVIGHGNPVLMDSSTFGLPVNSPKGYKEYIYKATQISTDGIYLHELSATIWAQGHTDVSHGCLNLSPSNATFFYGTSRVGDVVQVLHTGGPKLQIWQNGDWSVPWSTWLQGSALS